MPGHQAYCNLQKNFVLRKMTEIFLCVKFSLVLLYMVNIWHVFDINENITSEINANYGIVVYGISFATYHCEVSPRQLPILLASAYKLLENFQTIHT